MASKKNDIFWISYADLLSSLFFIILVLFAITFFKYNQKVENLKKKLEVFRLVEESLGPLKKKKDIFKYESDYKRFVLAEEVSFNISKTDITPTDVKDFPAKSAYLLKVGKGLKNTLDTIAYHRTKKEGLKDVSYLLVISGYASKLSVANEAEDYNLSYDRAYNLWKFWKRNGIDFEDLKYKGFVDLQIAGNGWGGMGRISSKNNSEEEGNQRFIIQIIPKTKNID
ncbi:membrane protein [Flavobacteriaceae bacterium 3519-10]|nr:membrane protein [Flavobacteriaceae bacterium 3519-10]